MATKTPTTTPKITVSIWANVLEKLRLKLDAACIGRDAYLNKLLEQELPRLDAEVTIPNSDQAKQWVLRWLNTEGPKRKQVSLKIDPLLSKQLDDICDRKGIVRDAFFNRVFLLLALKPAGIDRFLFPTWPEWKTDIWRGAEHDSQHQERDFYPLEAPIDPFWAMRYALSRDHESLQTEEVTVGTSGKTARVQRSPEGIEPLPSIYTVFFSDQLQGVDLRGLNCFVPDWRIPSTAAAHERRTLDDLIHNEL